MTANSTKKTDFLMRPCVEGDGFPLNDPRTTLLMYCPDNLNVTLTGNFFANEFKYLTLNLVPCATSTTNKCKSSSEVSAFFQKSSNMQFMYIDNYFDVEDYKILVHQFRNEERYFNVDLSLTQSANYFVRKQLVENTNDESDSRQSVTITRTTEDVTKFVAGNPLVQITLRLDSYEDYTVIERASWFSAIEGIGGMQGFIALVVVIVLGSVSEVDFVSEMITGLYLKRQPTKEYL